MATPFAIHNVRFFDLPPRSAHCLAYSRSRRVLALSRADNSIEIWHLGQGHDRQRKKRDAAPVLQRVIPAQETQGSVEALVWAGGGNKPTLTFNNVSNCDNLDEDYDTDDTHSATSKRSPSTGSNKKGISQPQHLKDNRLFSTGLHGLLIEHDLDRLDDELGGDTSVIQRTQAEQNVWSVTSGAAWCMSFNSRAGRLAIGTEEGYVSLFRVGGVNGLDFDKVLDKQEGRILCLDWHTDGKHIVTGSPDTIRLWDVSTGHPLTRMSTGRTEKYRETIVWSLIILDDFTVISGDSRGKTSFWNGRTGTLTDAYQTHIADVLTVATNGSQSIVYSSGVDPSIMQFQPVSTNFPSGVNRHAVSKNQYEVNQGNGLMDRGLQKRPKWVKTSHRSANTHDVRALLCVGKMLLSVGVDANLCINDTNTRSLTKFPPIPHGANVVFANMVSPSNGGRSKVALRYDNRIEVWNLGHALDITPNIGGASHLSWRNTYLPLREDAEKLLTLHAKDNISIKSFDMAADASAIAYVSTDGSVRIFQMEYETQASSETSQPKIRRIRLKKEVSSDEYDQTGNEQMTPSTPNIVKFLPKCDNESNLCMLLTTNGGTLQCYELPNSDESDGYAEYAATLMWNLLPRQDLDLHAGISHLEVHPRGMACAIADYDGNVRLINFKTSNSTVSSNGEGLGTHSIRNQVRKIPVYVSAVVSCMSFNPGIEGNLLIVYANHHFVEVDSVNGRYTKFTNDVATVGKKSQQLPIEWTEKKYATRGVVFVPEMGKKSEGNVIMFYDEANICTLNKSVWLKNITEVRSALNKETISASQPPMCKSAKRNKGQNGNIKPQNTHNFGRKQAMKITKKYEHLVHLGLFESSELFHVESELESNEYDKTNKTSQKHLTTSQCTTLAAVEVKPQTLESQLPPSVRQKKFGAM